MDKILKYDIQMKASEQYFPVVLFIMLYKVVITFLKTRLLTAKKSWSVFKFTMIAGQKDNTRIYTVQG